MNQLRYANSSGYLISCVRRETWNGTRENCELKNNVYTEEFCKTVGIDKKLPDYYEEDIVIRRINNIWFLGGTRFAYDMDWHPEAIEELREKHDDISDRLWKYTEYHTYEDFESIWSQAQNMVQWKGKHQQGDIHVPKRPVNTF